MEWTRGQTLGRGSSATVSIATANHSGEVFAVKSADLSQSKFLQREQRILSTLSCPQIVAYKGCDITIEEGRQLYNLFLEYAPGGSLVDAIRTAGGRLDELTVRSYARKILLGLEYLHSKGVVHCDIKCHNILVTADGPKIADLGCARWVNEVSSTATEDTATAHPIAGTPVYMAPEAARGERQGFPADVWALGCTILEMATGRALWANVLDPVSALYQIGFSGNVPEIPNFLSMQAQDFLSMCLRRDPEERWSASELLQHAFIGKTSNHYVPKEVPTNNVNTPTSVLDQDWWNSRDDESQTWNSSPSPTSSTDSPIKRIQQLIQGNEKVPDWLWDDTWITVRCNNSSQKQQMWPSIKDHSLPNASESTSISGACSIWFSEESSLVSPNSLTNVSGINKCITRIISGFCVSGSGHKVQLMLCKRTVDVLRGNRNFEKDINPVFFSILQVLRILFFGLISKMATYNPLRFTSKKSIIVNW